MCSRDSASTCVIERSLQHHAAKIIPPENSHCYTRQVPFPGSDAFHHPRQAVKKWFVTILAALAKLALALTADWWAPWILSLANHKHEDIEHLNNLAELISKLMMWHVTAILFIAGLSLGQTRRPQAGHRTRRGRTQYLRTNRKPQRREGQNATRHLEKRLTIPLHHGALDS